MFCRYIQCDACMAMGESLYDQTMKIFSEKGGSKKTGEEPILELLEAICEPDSTTGEWINKLDIVGSKGILKVQKKSNPGKCGKECRAVASVCEDVRLRAGESDIAEKLFRGHFTSSADEFSSALCGKLSDVCNNPAKELKKKRVDEPFKVVDSKVGK